MRDDFLINRNGSIQPDQLSGFFSGGKRVMRYGNKKSNAKAAFGFTKGKGYLHDVYDPSEYFLEDLGDEVYDNR